MAGVRCSFRLCAAVILCLPALTGFAADGGPGERIVFDIEDLEGALDEIVVGVFFEDQQAPVEIIGNLGEGVEIPVTLGEPHGIRCLGESVCCPDLTIPEGHAPGGTPIRIAVSNCRRFSFVVDVEDGSDPPREMLVEGSSGSGEIRRSIDLESEGGGFVDLPQGVWDLRFASNEWAPCYRWSVDPTNDGGEMKRLTLVRGSSVVGFVRDGGTGGAIEGIEIHLIEGRTDDSVPLDVSKKRMTLRPSVRSDPHGFFRFQRVPPGIYRLVVGGADRRPVRFGPYVVPEESELRLEDLQLPAESFIDIMVSPPSTPKGRPWNVEFVPMDFESDFKVGGETMVDSAGWVRFHRVTRGRWMISVKDGTGRSARTETLELEGGDTIDLPLDIVEIRGSVRWKGEALAARLTLSFEGVKGAGSRPFDTESDADGNFATWIPSPKKYLRFRIESTDPPLDCNITREVPEKRGSVLKYVLDLSGPSVEGVVVDHAGVPVPGAGVTIRSQARPPSSVTTVASQDGRFDVSLPFEGAFEVWAVSVGGRRSRTVRFEVSPDELELRLLELREVSGTVTHRGGPVGSARIRVLRGSGGWSAATTDHNGKFKITIDGKGRMLTISVAAPGVMLWAGQVNLLDDPEVLWIRLPQGGVGTLVLEDPYQGMTVVTAEGGLLDPICLLSWAMAMGLDTRELGRSDLVLPAVSAGGYARTKASVLSEGPASLGSSASLEWSYLGAGGSIVLGSAQE